MAARAAELRPGPVRPMRPISDLVASNERLVYALLGFVSVAVAWELVADLGLFRVRLLLSAPSRIVAVAATDMASGELWGHISVSGVEYGLGLILAFVIGVPLGLAIGLVRPLDHFLGPLLAGLYSTPKVVLIPLIILVAGLDLEAKLIVVFLHAIFALIVSASTGVRSVNARHLEITSSFGASRRLVFTSVILPSTFPFILSGTRIASGRALIGVVSAEFLAANQGIGYYISFHGTFLDTSRVMVGIILLGIYGLTAGELLRRIEHRFERWRPELRH